METKKYSLMMLIMFIVLIIVILFLNFYFVDSGYSIITGSTTKEIENKEIKDGIAIVILLIIITIFLMILGYRFIMQP
ncbi:MAG: hypothetical protein ABIC04_03605 [Nanoarchaeota archaeon]